MRPSGVSAIVAGVLLSVTVLMLVPLWLQADFALRVGNYPRITVILYLVCVGLLAFWMIYAICDSIFCDRDTLCMLTLVTLITLISVGVLNLTAFILTCIEFDFWWNYNGSAGRAFFILSVLNMASSVFSSKKFSKVKK